MDVLEDAPPAAPNAPTRPPPQGWRWRRVLRQELRLLRLDRSVWWAGALFFLLIGYALHNGIAQTEARATAQTELLRHDAVTREAQRQRLERMLAGAEPATPFGNPANPEHMAGSFGAHHAWLPAVPLAPVALGQSDLYPSQFQVSYRSKVSFIHDDEIENPWHLLNGHFDLAFVIVYVLPLLIIAVSFNMLSAERESGTLRLLLSQPLALRTLLAAKVSARSSVLLGAVVLLPGAVLLAARPIQTVQAGAAAGWWVLLVALYALFWFALVVAVNALGRSSATNALVLVVAWVVLVLVAPVLLNLALAAASPMPSRTELAARIRVVTAQAMARNAELLATDYQHVGKPDLLLPRDGRISLAGRSLANYRIEREVDDAIRPELVRFDERQARQQALLSHVAVVSPAAVMQEGMTALAGNGAQRRAHFMRQVDDYHRAWKGFFFPRIESERAVRPDDFAAMPVYVWHEEAQGATTAVARRAALQLFLPTLLLLAFAGWRLRRYPVV